jgi:hypothetical protein
MSKTKKTATKAQAKRPRTPKTTPSLALTLVAMRMFELEDGTAHEWLSSAGSTVEKTLRGMATAVSDMKGEVPYGHITTAAVAEHEKAQKDIDARIDKVAGADAFKLKDDIDIHQYSIAGSAAFLGMLVGWALRERMNTDLGGAR